MQKLHHLHNFGDQTAISRRPPSNSPENSFPASVNHQKLQNACLRHHEYKPIINFINRGRMWPELEERSRRRRLLFPPPSSNPRSHTHPMPMYTFLITIPIYSYHQNVPRCSESKIRPKHSRTHEEHQEHNFKNQTNFSLCYRSQNSTYNIPKRREKHALHHRIIKTIKKSRLQKFTI